MGLIFCGHLFLENIEDFDDLMSVVCFNVRMGAPRWDRSLGLGDVSIKKGMGTGV